MLKQAETELDEIKQEKDQDFLVNIQKVDVELTNLLNEINTGVDGGDKTIMELINNVFDDFNKATRHANEIDERLKIINKQNAAADEIQKELKEMLREIQENINKQANRTSDLGPMVLQDARDRSEKLHDEAGQLKAILDEMKLILISYEENLKNAKDLSSEAIEKFTDATKKVDQTLAEQTFVEEKLKQTFDLETSHEELEAAEKLTKIAKENAEKVFEKAFDLLNEVSELELNDRLEEINERVEKLKNFSTQAHTSLEDFANKSSEFLDKMERTIDDAELLEAKARRLQLEIDKSMKAFQEISKKAQKAVDDTNETIKTARNIANSLQDFNFKVEESRMSARISMEKIPEIVNIIQESINIVEKLENGVDETAQATLSAKQKCSKAKNEMDEILDESNNIKSRTGIISDETENLMKQLSVGNKLTTKNTRDTDKLEAVEAKDNKLIESTKEKVEKSRLEVDEIDNKLENALSEIKRVLQTVTDMKEIDETALQELGKFLNRIITFSYCKRRHYRTLFINFHFPFQISRN